MLPSIPAKLEAQRQTKKKCKDNIAEFEQVIYELEKLSELLDSKIEEAKSTEKDLRRIQTKVDDCSIPESIEKRTSEVKSFNQIF